MVAENVNDMAYRNYDDMEIGNCVAVVVIARWEGDINLEQAKNVLAAGADEKSVP